MRKVPLLRVLGEERRNFFRQPPCLKPRMVDFDLVESKRFRDLVFADYVNLLLAFSVPPPAYSRAAPLQFSSCRHRHRCFVNGGFVNGRWRVYCLIFRQNCKRAGKPIGVATRCQEQMDFSFSTDAAKKFFSKSHENAAMCGVTMHFGC